MGRTGPASGYRVGGLSLERLSAALRRRSGLIASLAAALLTTGLAAMRLGQAFWIDEAASVWFARQPLAELGGRLCDPHPPAYYLALKLWLTAGAGEAWLRLPSLLAAVLSIALCYRLARAIPGVPAGIAALLLAVQPLQAWYAGEARMYALAQCLALAAFLAGWLLLDQLLRPAASPRRGLSLVSSLDSGAGTRSASFAGNGPGARRRTAGAAAVACLVAGILALWVDYSALAPFVLLQLAWLARGRPAPRLWPALQAGVLLGGLVPWLRGSTLAALHDGYVSVFLAVRVTRLGLYFPPSAAAVLLLAALLACLAGATALAWCWRKWSGPRERWWPAVGLIAWGAFLVWSALPGTLSAKRQLLVLLPYLSLWAAGSVAALERRGPRPTLAGPFSYLKLALPILGLGACLIALSLYPRELGEPWRDVVTWLGGATEAGRPAIWVEDLAAPAVDYYLRQDGATGWPAGWQPLMVRQLPELPPVAPGRPVWLVTLETPYRDVPALLPDAFHARYELAEETRFGGISVIRYAARPYGAAPRAAVSPEAVAVWGGLLRSPLDSCN